MPGTLEVLQDALGDRYQIEREIGSGGMATVFLARDLRNKREVALKVLKAELGAVLGTERFLSEITVTANLQHPNLLPLFDSGEAGGLLFYVMPFVRGETLRAKVDREKQLSVDEAVRIAVAVASALHHAHEHGVIHRDLKPENILMQSGQPVIADFGIALAVSNAGGTRVTQTGLSLGTPQYMSPEQATGDRVIDARSDIYSLGAVTYEMLAGEPPHSGASAQAIIAKLMTSEPQPLHTLRSTIPLNVACAVEKALAKLPADRFATAHEFAAALQNPSFTIATRQGRANVEQAAAAKKWKRIAIAASALAGGLMAATLWAIWKPAPPQPVLRYALAIDSSHTLGGGLSRAALSPDGLTIVYSILPEMQLVLRERNQLNGVPVPGVIQAYSPFFSADGRKIGYLSPPGLLKVVTLGGGPPVQISDSISGEGGTFGPDDYIYATITGRSRGIVRVGSSPGSPLERITRPDSARGESSHAWPEILPDGRGMIFTILYDGRKSPAIAAADLETGKYEIVANGVRARYSPTGHMLVATIDGVLTMIPFDAKKRRTTGAPAPIAQGLRVGGASRATDFAIARTGTLFYVAGGTNAERELVWVGRDGKTEPIDPAWKETFNSPSLSPDGKRLAVSLGAVPGSDIWIKQLDRGPSLKLTFGGAENIYPVWTPDGQEVTYAGNGPSGQNIHTKRADGSAQARMELDLPRDVSGSHWSRDREWLIVRTSARAEGAGDILAMRPGVDSVPTPLIATKFGETDPALSPDGRWLAYTSDETGRSEIYVVPFPNVATARWPVSTRGGREPLWSHSGKELFYRTPDRHLMSVAVTTRPIFSAGPATILFSEERFTSNFNRRQYDITPDDKRFIFVRPLSGFAQNDLTFVENWFEAARRR